jgi:signal transduction histidine kinase
LADHLPADEQEFGDVWTTHAATNGVYFQTSYRVYFWDGASFTVYRSEGGYHTSFLIDDELIVRERGRGLVRLKNGQSELLPGGDFYAEKRVHVLMRETTGFLVGTRDNGFFRWNGEKSERVVTEADPILRRAWLYGSAELHTGEIALATLGAGVVVIDRQGKLTAHLNTANGAPDDNITSLYRLRSGLVVATTHNAGLFTFYSPSLLTEVAAFEFGAINDILLDSEYAFISTGGGGLTLSMDSVRAAVRGQRRPVGWGNGLKTSWTAVRAGGYVYAATEEGLFRTRADRMVADRAPSFTPVNSEFQVFALGTSGADTILAGYRRGLGVAKASVWHHQQEGTDIDELVSIVADASGIWATTRIDGVRLYGRPDPFGSPPVKYSVTDGLPANEKLVVVMAGGAPLYFTKEASGFYRFDASSGTFRKDYALAGNGIENAAVYDVHEASDGTIWLALSDGIARATPSRSGGFVIERPELLQFVRSRNTILATEPGGALWFTLDDRILRYEPSMEAPVDMEYNAILERIVSTATDSLLFGGFQSGTASRGLSRFDLELPHERRGIRVEFGTPMLFDIGRPVEYRTFLEGFDKDWQPWSQSTSRTISEEKEGEYVLRVEARNMYGIVSRDARVYLSILPPWYRSWWAYAIYLIGSVLVVTFTVKYRRMVKAQKRAHAQAEELARERRYSQRLQEANDQLKRANRLKDEFLATTSHELRTPITAILGFTEVLNNEIPADAPYREFVSIIEESGQRLMSTLTSLLDVARIRAGTMELVPQPVDLRETVRHSAETRRGQAEGKGLYFKVVLPEEPIDALQDPSAIERVIQHLLDNAVKFTEQGGITVEIGREGENASIRVHDTGLGIDAAFLPSLFEEFVQESDGERRSHNGNGLGLAIVGGLVRMMGGRVDVHSMKGVGSVFKVLVPIGGAESEPGSVVGAESGREYPGSELQRSGAGDRHPFGPTRLRKVTVPREARAD